MWEAYRAQDRGGDLHDDLASGWSLSDFDRLLWRPGAVQHAAVALDVPVALGRLVDIDFRNRAGRFEYWRLAGPDPVVAGALVEGALRHAFAELGLHRVAFLLPSYLDGADHEAVTRWFEPEGTLSAYLFRRGRWWDVQAFGVLEARTP